MSSRNFMINLMADVIGLSNKYTGNRLNDRDIWDDFIQDVFNRIDTIEDDQIRNVLNAVDKEEFQSWIDDPEFWTDVDNKIIHRNQLIKTVLPSNQDGHC